MGKSEDSGFSETIAACDLKVCSCRQLIVFMKVCEYKRSMSFLYHIFQVLYVLCFTRTRYQVSVYRTIGPLVRTEAVLTSTNNVCFEQKYVIYKNDVYPCKSQSGVFLY